MRAIVWMSLSCCALLLATPADAASGKDQVRRLQQRLSALEQEKGQLLQEKSELDGKLKESTGQIVHAKQGAEVANRKLVSLEAKLRTSEQEKSDLAHKVEALEEKRAATGKELAETAASLRQEQQVRAQVEANLGQRNKDYASCVTRNESLHRTGLSLLKDYEEKTCTTSVLQGEPLTQLKRVSLENALEDYRQKLDAQRIGDAAAERRQAAEQKEEARRQEALREAREKAQAVIAEQAVEKQKRKREQHLINDVTREVTGFFEDIEWW